VKPGSPRDAPVRWALPSITVPGTRLVTGPLGFGCADLYREPGVSGRRRILDEAHAGGIRHFDVAPMYGLGLAERELGHFARGRREEVVIATKFGITPTGIAQGLAKVQGPVRRLLSTFPALRQRARSSAAGPASGWSGSLLYCASGFDASAARRSLERSLRELGTDYVDLLLLHDPPPGEVHREDVCEYLEQARDVGLIRAWGLAGELEPMARLADALPVKPSVLQVRTDLLERRDGDVAVSFATRITFGLLGGSITRIVRHVASEPERERAWRARVGHDCADPEVVATLLLRLAVRENPRGVVLFSTIRTEHIRSAIEAVAESGRSSDEDLDAFVGLLDAELRARG
jgi:D-threo-aldose 1-dehydrogenase